MHLLYFGCALDVVRLFLHAFEDEEAAKLLGWDCHSPAPRPSRPQRPRVLIPSHQLLRKKPNMTFASSTLLQPPLAPLSQKSPEK